MRDTLLEHAILRILDNKAKAIRQSALAAEIDARIDGNELTVNDLKDTLRRLEDLGLISHRNDLLRYTRWSMTENGKRALKEINGFGDI